MEGGSTTRLPILDGTNYDYWKAQMVAFLKPMDSKTWKAIIKGWEHYVVMDKEGNTTTTLKPEEEWSKDEDEIALGNSRAFKTLFRGADIKMFKLINTCTMAKDTWKILITTHEGTSKVRMSRLQLLTTKFENIMMKDYESIHDFHMSILDIANTSSALGETMPQDKLIRKILRSLTKRFNMKITVIEEAQDISNIENG